MASEYLNNKKLESIIIEFQKLKKHKKMYSYIIENSKESKKPCWTAVNNLNSEIQTKYGIVQTDLAKAFYTLSENIVRYAKFNLIDPDDSIQEGVLICFEKLDRFNPKVGKAFNYMTTCILNHFKQLYRSARNYGELKKRYQDLISKEIQSEINYSRTPKQKN